MATSGDAAPAPSAPDDASRPARTDIAAEIADPTHLKVHKVLNNNVLVSLDEAGQERVLMGRGLGFQAKRGDLVDAALVEKTFILDRGEQSEHVQSLLQETPYEVVRAATDAAALAEKELGRSLGRTFTIAVIDHLQYLLERMDQGLSIPTAPIEELKVIYPNEFAAATKMTAFLGETLTRVFPEEERVFLTMHVLNATRDEPSGTTTTLFRRLHAVTGIVEKGINQALPTDSPDYDRFILHMKFLLQRLAGGTLLHGRDSTLFDVASNSYPESYALSLQVRDYLQEDSQQELTDEEVLYLIVHVERLRTVLM